MHNASKDFVCHLKIVPGFFFRFFFFVWHFRRFLCDSVNSFDKIKLLLVNLSFSNCLSSVGICYNIISCNQLACIAKLQFTSISSSSCLLWLKLMIKSVFGLSSNCTNFLYIYFLSFILNLLLFLFLHFCPIQLWWQALDPLIHTHTHTHTQRHTRKKRKKIDKKMHIPATLVHTVQPQILQSNIALSG